MPDHCDDHCPIGAPSEIANLRRDIDAKHLQNRRDIHNIRNEQQKMMLEFARLEGKFMPLIDNGQPGLISRMSTRLEEVADMLTDVQISQGIEKGKRTVEEWMVDGVKALIIGGILALVTHYWK